MGDYASQEISTDLLNTENHGQLEVKAEVDTLGMATITFGNSFTLRANEFNIDELRSILFEASRALALVQCGQVGKWNLPDDGELNEVPATLFFSSSKATQ